MDFSWSDQQRELLDAVSRFAKEQLDYDMIEADRNAVFNHDAWKKCGGFGITGCSSRRVRRPRAGAITTVAVLERLGHACKDNGLPFSINAHMWTAIIPLVYNGRRRRRKSSYPASATARSSAATP
jgi:alkylation response protein AidB-like acyl-CoA dehydrogenase